MTERITHEEWTRRGRERFQHGNVRAWLFVCPSCGQEQSFRQLADLGVPHPERYVAFACIGRFNLNLPARADEVVAPPAATKGFGCTYSNGTPHHVAPFLLILPTGEERPTFGFAP